MVQLFGRLHEVNQVVFVSVLLSELVIRFEISPY